MGPQFYSIPELDNRARFWNSFCKIWSQNQDPGLSFAASALTRRDASNGIHFVFFQPRFGEKWVSGFRDFGPLFGPCWPYSSMLAPYCPSLWSCPRCTTYTSCGALECQSPGSIHSWNQGSSVPKRILAPPQRANRKSGPLGTISKHC